MKPHQPPQGPNLPLTPPRCFGLAMGVKGVNWGTHDFDKTSPRKENLLSSPRFSRVQTASQRCRHKGFPFERTGAKGPFPAYNRPPPRAGSWCPFEEMLPTSRICRRWMLVRTRRSVQSKFAGGKLSRNPCPAQTARTPLPWFWPPLHVRFHCRPAHGHRPRSGLLSSLSLCSHAFHVPRAAAPQGEGRHPARELPPPRSTP